MIRTFIDRTTGSWARRRLADVGEETIEHVLVVAWTGRALGVVLIGADRQRAVRETFYGAVIEIPRADVEVIARRDRLFVDLELVVLTRDDDAAGAHVLHRMIRAVMSERQARRRGSY